MNPQRPSAQRRCTCYVSWWRPLWIWMVGIRGHRAACYVRQARQPRR